MDKRCTKCGNSFPATAEFFSRDKGAKDGLMWFCKECNRARGRKYHQEHREEGHQKYREWSEKNREHNQARHKVYRATHLDQVKAKEKEYRRQHGDLLSARSKRYREMHLDYFREKGRQHYWKDPERSKRNSSQWRKDHPERARELDRRYRAKHAKARAIKAATKRVRTPRTKMSLEEQQAKWREYYHKNPKYHSQRAMKYFHDRPGYRASIEANRRARKKSIPGTHTLEQIHDLLKRQRYRCYYCKNKFKRINGNYSFEIEHTFPVKRVAGTAIPANDISYIVLACKPCNASKGSRFPWEYPEGGRLL